MNIQTITPKPRHIPFILLAIIALILSVGLVLTLLQTKAPASSGNIYLENASVSADKGDTVKFAVRIAPGAKIDTVTATAEYDEDRLEYAKTEYTDSPFGSQIPATESGDKITIQSAKLGGETVNSDAYVATIIFTAQESGSQKLALVDGNAAHAGVATNPSVMGKTIERSASLAPGSTAVDTANDASADSTAPLEAVTDTLASPISSILESTGMAPDTAKRASLWIVGMLVCGIIAAVIAIIIVHKKRQAAKLAKTQPPQQGAEL
jgi:hypothetical protein